MNEQQRNSKTDMPWMAVLLFLGLVLAAAAPSGAVGPGDRAPEFAAPALDGSGTVSLGQFRGKVVYVDFWASWCAPCLVALPAMEELRKEFPASEFQVLAVNLDSSAGKAQKFLKKHPVGYPSVVDPDGRIPERFGLKTMPTSYLVDRKGVVRWVHPGFSKDDVSDIRAQIKKWVGRR